MRPDTDRKSRRPTPRLIPPQARENRRDRLQRQPEASHQHEDLQEAQQVFPLGEQLPEGRSASPALFEDLRLIHEVYVVKDEGEGEEGPDDERYPPTPLHIGRVYVAGRYEEEQDRRDCGDCGEG